MNDSLVDLGMALVCETCECEIDFPDEVASELGVCRQCGMAFLLEVVAPTSRTHTSRAQSAWSEWA